MRKTGYLANILNVPPLIFRFQFNPELMSDKKSFKYVAADSFGEWGFDKTKAASGFLSTLGGLSDDVKDIASLLTGVKPLHAEEGGDRTIALDFKLVAGEYPEGLLDESDGYERTTIEPELALLRSFMYPAWDLIDVGKMIFTQDVQCWSRPPECSLVYGGLSLTCVMTDLNIKVTDFDEEDASPMRADVSLTLKEQPWSYSPLVDFVKRHYNVALSYGRPGYWSEDLPAVIPGGTQIVGLFD